MCEYTHILQLQSIAITPQREGKYDPFAARQSGARMCSVFTTSVFTTSDFTTSVFTTVHIWYNALSTIHLPHASLGPVVTRTSGTGGAAALALHAQSTKPQRHTMS